jgi:hypothetical protein
LTSITIPQEITVIEASPFGFNSNLSSLYFEDKSLITELPTSFLEGSKITGIKIPDSVQKIGVQAFRTTPLSKVEFGPASKLEAIENSAFENSKITSFVASPLLKTVGNNVFNNTSDLKTITLPISLQGSYTAVTQPYGFTATQ